MADKKIEKARGPFGGKIIPERYNQAASADTVGGFQDAQATRGGAMANTARRGAGAGANASRMIGQTSTPTNRPGGRRTAPASPTAPRSQAMGRKVSNETTSPAGETEGRSMARLARRGGKLKMSPDGHRQVALPTPVPTFPKADNPGGSPNKQPSGGGRMTGVTQGGRGKTTAGRTNVQT